MTSLVRHTAAASTEESDNAAGVASPARPASIDIGARLRTIRIKLGLSQRKLASRAGVTNGLISLIEQNRTSPSIASLKLILDAVPMSFAEFFAVAETDPHQFVHRAADMPEINPLRAHGSSADNRASETDHSGISFRLVGGPSEHALQMLHETYAPGADTGEELYSHEAEEAGVVISGQIEITVGDEVELLDAGDSYLFDSRKPHRFRNVGDEPCELVSACTPPTF